MRRKTMNLYQYFKFNITLLNFIVSFSFILKILVFNNAVTVVFCKR
jgi:hypothetical protein